MNVIETKVYIGDITYLFEDSGLYDSYYSELSVFRREKAEKYKNHKDRCRSVGAGTLLKHALSDCGLSEKDVRYGTVMNGKPVIEGFPGIYFNLSHSGSRVMCAVSCRPVGCDVEQIRDRGETGRRMADRFFSKEELAYLEENGIYGKERFDEAFFTVWTLKESYIKCTGEGLGRTMEGFSILKTSEGFKVKEDENVMLNVIDSGQENDTYRYAICIKKRTSDELMNITRSYIVL